MVPLVSELSWDHPPSRHVQKEIRTIISKRKEWEYTIRGGSKPKDWYLSVLPSLGSQRILGVLEVLGIPRLDGMTWHGSIFWCPVCMGGPSLPLACGTHARIPGVAGVLGVLGSGWNGLTRRSPKFLVAAYVTPPCRATDY